MAAVLGTIGLTPGARADSSSLAASSPEVRAALERAGLSQRRDFGERAAKAAWVPRLSVGARRFQVTVPGLSARSIEVFAWVRWPLERRATRGLGDLGPLSTRRQELAELAAARATELARTRARPEGKTAREAVDGALDEEEACAELVALGAASEGCP